METKVDLEKWIRDVPDFPKPGIVFKDITPLLGEGPALREAVERLSEPYAGKVDRVLGIESRGFILGTAAAFHLGLGVSLVRKAGKLPAAVHRAEYALEYGSDCLEIHRDAFEEGTRVLVVDDLLATGGTAGATVDLVRRLGGEVVACAFLIELAFLGGRERLKNVPIRSLIRYDGE